MVGGIENEGEAMPRTHQSQPLSLKAKVAIEDRHEEPDHPRGRCFSAEPAACAHHEDPGDLPFHGHAHDTRPARPDHAARSA